MDAATDAVYLRVLEDLRAQIRDGVLGPGARVPSRNGIIAKYGVGETAAKHALGVLAAEGLIETRAGSGSYVRAVPATRSLDHGRPDVPWSPFGLPDARDSRDLKRLFASQPPRDLAFRYGYPDKDGHAHLVVTRRAAPGSP